MLSETARQEGVRPSPSPSPSSSSSPDSAGRRRLVLPREHGAWAMLAAPYVVGAAAAGFTPVLLPAALMVLLVYLSRPPLALLIKRWSRGSSSSAAEGSLWLWLGFAVPLAAALVVAAVLMAAGSRWLLPLFGLAGLALSIAHTAFVLKRRERTTAAELTGVVMLTLTAPLAFYLSSGRLGRDAAVLWLLDAAYFGASVFYLRMRLRAFSLSRRGRGEPFWKAAGACIAYTDSMLLLALLLSLAGWAPRLTLLAYAPAGLYIYTNLTKLGGPINIKQEGFKQSILAALFVLLMILAYRS